MADDLRTVLITLKISGILERIADHIVNITKKIDHQIKIPEYFSSKMDLEALGKLVGENFSTVINLYKEPSNEMAKEVLRKDMLCNELFSEICKKNLDDISKSNEQKECKFFIEINFIAKEFERIGDLVKNISKEVRYSISGKLDKVGNTILIVEDDESLLPMLTYNLKKKKDLMLSLQAQGKKA